MKKETKIFILLCILTLFAFLLGYYELLDSNLVTILLLSTFIKGFFVIENFMGLSEVQIKYRIIPSIWLALVISLIALAYYFPLTN